jgi:hypothetical protein
MQDSLEYGQIDVSYPVLYPPPPGTAEGQDTHNILIQRIPSRSIISL